MSTVVMYASMSVFIAAENDDPGPLFDWLTREPPLASHGVMIESRGAA